MKKVLTFALMMVMMVVANNAFAQDAQVIKLDQTAGEFTIQGLVLEAGDYIFEITNDGVDHELGFVLVPEGKSDQKDHIQAAYVQKTVNDGETSQSKVVTLEKGTYEYFCPLNPTPHYKIIVE